MASKSEVDKKGPFEVSVALDHTSSTAPYALDVTLTNRSSHTWTLYEHSLPWIGAHSMLLIVVRGDAVGTPIDSNLPIDDPGPATISIAPAASLRGTIPLQPRFPGFLEALYERDVIVFWSYHVQPVDSPPLPRVGGAVIFPQVEQPS